MKDKKNSKKKFRFHLEFFPNGRFIAIPAEMYDDAIKEGKEILFICNGWAGGYARAEGASRQPGYYEGDPEYIYNCYGYEVKDVVLKPEDMKKFYAIVINDGYRVIMKTGEEATAECSGRYSDWDTTYEEFIRRNQWKLQKLKKEVSKEEYEETIRHTVDVEATLSNLEYAARHDFGDDGAKEFCKVLKNYF